MHRRHAPSTASSGDAARSGDTTVVVPASARPRVLCVVNRPGWAHDRKTDALVRVLGDRYDLDKRFQADVTAADFEAADAILFYYWLQIDELPHLRPLLRARRDRLLIGVCSHHELDGAWRNAGPRHALRAARAVFVNNRLLLDELEPLLAGSRLLHAQRGRHDLLSAAAGAAARPALACASAGRAASPTTVRRIGACTRSSPLPPRWWEPSCASPRARRSGAPRRRWSSSTSSLDVYVCASRSEGTPNPCLEAAACGLPVVTTARGQHAGAHPRRRERLPRRTTGGGRRRPAGAAARRRRRCAPGWGRRRAPPSQPGTGGSRRGDMSRCSTSRSEMSLAAERASGDESPRFAWLVAVPSRP